MEPRDDTGEIGAGSPITRIQPLERAVAKGQSLSIFTAKGHNGYGGKQPEATSNNRGHIVNGHNTFQGIGANQPLNRSQKQCLQVKWVPLLAFSAFSGATACFCPG